MRRRWVEVHGVEPTPADVDRMFEDFVPMQEACLSEYSQLIPGTVEIVNECRARGYKIGSTSGYLPGMLAINQADAAKQGYRRTPPLVPGRYRAVARMATWSCAIS